MIARDGRIRNSRPEIIPDMFITDRQNDNLLPGRLIPADQFRELHFYPFIDSRKGSIIELIRLY